MSKEPTFALGDASGVSPTPRYTILMIDTTCDNARTLHYARTNFKYNFDIVKIESSTDAEQAYKAPGSFGETGDDRKYSFLMYLQPQNQEISSLKLPDEGKTFDAQQFQSDNGFQGAEAGVGMVVKLGGQVNCDGSGSGQAGESSGAVSQASNTAASSTSAAPSRGTSAAASKATSAVSSPTFTTKGPSTPLSSAAQSSQIGQQSSDESSSDAVTRISTSAAAVAASSVLENSAVPSTPVLTSVAPDATGSSTGTGAAAQQTTAGASELSIGVVISLVAASMMMFAGLLAW